MLKYSKELRLRLRMYTPLTSRHLLICDGWRMRKACASAVLCTAYQPMRKHGSGRTQSFVGAPLLAVPSLLTRHALDEDPPMTDRSHQ